MIIIGYSNWQQELRKSNGSYQNVGDNRGTAAGIRREEIAVPNEDGWCC
jgi:hypothetical protein